MGLEGRAGTPNLPQSAQNFTLGTWGGAPDFLGVHFEPCGPFETVARRTDHVIVYLTRDTLSRPWCAGEVVTAFRGKGKIRMSAVICPSFLPPTDLELRNLDSYLDMTGCSLCEYGILLDEVAEAFRSLLDGRPGPSFKGEIGSSIGK